jgi:hypothetical protein
MDPVLSAERTTRAPAPGMTKMFPGLVR